MIARVYGSIPRRLSLFWHPLSPHFSKMNKTRFKVNSRPVTNHLFINWLMKYYLDIGVGFSIKIERITWIFFKPKSEKNSSHRSVLIEWELDTRENSNNSNNNNNSAQKNLHITNELFKGIRTTLLKLSRKSIDILLRLWSVIAIIIIIIPFHSNNRINCQVYRLPSNKNNSINKPWNSIQWPRIMNERIHHFQLKIR